MFNQEKKQLVGGKNCVFTGASEKKVGEKFGGKEKSCNFAVSKQEQHLYKVAKYLYANISVKVSYSRNAIQQKAQALVLTAPTHGFFNFTIMSKQEKKQLDAKVGGKNCVFTGASEKKVGEKFGGKEKSCTFAPHNQGLYLYKNSNKYFNNISVKVCAVVMPYDNVRKPLVMQHPLTDFLIFKDMHNQEKKQLDAKVGGKNCVFTDVHHVEAMREETKLNTAERAVVRMLWSELLKEYKGASVSQVNGRWRIVVGPYRVEGESLDEAMVDLFWAKEEVSLKTMGV